MPGILTLCATPIGNLGDASPRLAEALAQADLVYAEDTRRARVLLERLGVARPVRSFFVGNEESRSDELAARLEEGASVALVTDAGTPAVADPGVSAVRAARAAGAEVTVIPGPSAVTAAIAVAGFGGDRFAFEGFLPRQGRNRRRRLIEIAGERKTVVLFSTPHRLIKDLEDLAAVTDAGRELCVAREITKRFEEIWWGTIGSAVDHWRDAEPRGEFTVVLAPGEDEPVDPEEAVELARSYLAEGASRSHAARRAAGETGVSRRLIYDRM